MQVSQGDIEDSIVRLVWLKDIWVEHELKRLVRTALDVSNEPVTTAVGALVRNGSLLLVHDKSDPNDREFYLCATDCDMPFMKYHVIDLKG